MWTKLVEREADEVDRLTLAIAQGQGIAFGGRDAYDAWQRSRGRKSQSQGQSVAQYQATLAKWTGRGLVKNERAN
jgi:hypothetical protein